MEFLFPIGMAAVAIVAVLLQSRRIRARKTDWRLAAEGSGLDLRVTSHGAAGLTAEGEGVRIDFRFESRESIGEVVAVEVRPHPWAHPEIAVRAPSRDAEIAGTYPATRVPTGDTVFDSSIFLSGPPDVLLAIFDSEMRSALLRMTSDSSILVGLGVVTASVREGRVHGVRILFLRSLVRFASRLGSEIDVAAALARNAREESPAAVRAQNLRALLAAYGDSPIAKGALESARQDPFPQMRILAARELRAEGVGDLLALLDDESIGDALGAEVVQALGRHFPADRLEPSLRLALRRRRLQTAGACAELAGRMRLPSCGSTLRRIVEVEKADLAATAAIALGQLGAEDAEAVLIAAIERDEPELTAAAVAALGRVGTVAAVAALRQVGERSSAIDGMTRAVDSAIASIRARSPGANPGQLSLAQSAVGALSLPIGAPGALTLSRGASDDPAAPPRKSAPP